MEQLEVYIGFSATPLESFKPFLSACARFFLLDNALFEPDEINCGVPQHSTLAPTLFSIYVLGFHFPLL